MNLSWLLTFTLSNFALQSISKTMKWFLASVAVIIGSGLLFGKLAANFIDSEQQTRKEHYCQELKVWHPDCKVE